MGKFYIALLSLIVAACSDLNNYDGTAEFSHIYIQNSSSGSFEVSVALDNLNVFNGLVGPSPIMPPVVKDIMIDDIAKYSRIAAAINGNVFSKELSDSVVDIVIRVSKNTDPITLYFERVKLK